MRLLATGGADEGFGSPPGLATRCIHGSAAAPLPGWTWVRPG